MNDPKTCLEPIPLCVSKGQHEPVCRCVLDAGHVGEHTSTPDRPSMLAPKPPKTPSGSGGIGKAPDQMDLTVKEMTQHVYQHQGEPRDLDYRAQAFSLALGVTSRHPSKYFTSEEMIEISANIENYLRNGRP